MLQAYRTESCLLERPEELKQAWLDLEARADSSYFLSWGWIGTWLQQIAIDLNPVIVKVWAEDGLVGLGIFIHADIKRRLFIHTKAMFLNEYPFEQKNIVIEFNDLLAERGHEKAVATEIVEHLLQQYGEYDEFHFGALADTSSLSELSETGSGCRFRSINVQESTAWSVDLRKFGEGIDAYMATLGKNRRLQIQRSLRLYEEYSPLHLQEADTTEEALRFLDGLKELHMERWRTAGRQGSFSNPVWEGFHRALIQSRFPENEVQLLQVSNEEGPIGYLYSFIWRKHVYVLQSGFKISEDKRLMPGYVVHVHAIVHNKNKGMEIYDLMHGDSLYKRLLCNRSERLKWMVIQRERWKFRLEDSLSKIVRQTRAAFKLVHRADKGVSG